MSSSIEDKKKNSLYRKAIVAIEYRPEAKVAFESLRKLPKNFKIRFLELLNENPKGIVEEYVSVVQNEYATWLNPYDRKELNEALQKVRAIGPNAEEEFKSVIDILGESANPDTVVKKIISTTPSALVEDENSALYELCRKYNDNTIGLMNRLGVSYNKGGYYYNEKRYDKFVDALANADRDQAGSNFAMAENAEEILKENIDLNRESPKSLTDNKGFFSKLARGEFGLAKTYWLYGVIVGVIANVFMNFITSITGLVVTIVVYTAYEIPLLIGIWRASDKYQGPNVWAVLAKIAVILGTIMLAFGLFAIVRLLNHA